LCSCRQLLYDRPALHRTCLCREVGVFRRGCVTFAEYFTRKGASPTNHCWCQKTRVTELSCGIKISTVHRLVLSKYSHLTDRRTDRIATAIQYRALHNMQSHGNKTLKYFQNYFKIIYFTCNHDIKMLIIISDIILCEFSSPGRDTATFHKLGCPFFLPPLLSSSLPSFPFPGPTSSSQLEGLGSAEPDCQTVSVHFEMENRPKINKRFKNSFSAMWRISENNKMT